MQLLPVVVVVAALARGQEQPDACPCRTRLQCPDHYGTRALDVHHFGVLGPCAEFGHFRCCDRATSSHRQHTVLEHQLGVRHQRGPARRRRPLIHAAALAPDQSSSDPRDRGETLSSSDPRDRGERLSSSDPRDRGETLSNSDPRDRGETLSSSGPHPPPPQHSPAAGLAQAGDLTTDPGAACCGTESAGSPADATAGHGQIGSIQTSSAPVDKIVSIQTSSAPIDKIVSIPTSSAPIDGAQSVILFDGADSSAAVHSERQAGHTLSSDVTPLENVEKHFEEVLSSAEPPHLFDSSSPLANAEPKGTAETFLVTGTNGETQYSPVTEAAFQLVPAEEEDRFRPDVISETVFPSTPIAETAIQQETLIESDGILPENGAQISDVVEGLVYPENVSGEQPGEYVLDVRAARTHPRIRAFRGQTVTPVANITKSGELSPPCGCYTCGTCGAAQLDAGTHALITCPPGFDRCCFPEDPWPDFVATEAESAAPCSLSSRCRRAYGESPLDVQLFGLLLPCYLGQVRCLDLLLQEADLMPSSGALPCPAAGSGAAPELGLSAPTLDVQFKAPLQDTDIPSPQSGHFEPSPPIDTTPSTVTFSTDYVDDANTSFVSGPSNTESNLDAAATLRDIKNTPDIEHMVSNMKGNEATSVKGQNNVDSSRNPGESVPSFTSAKTPDVLSKDLVPPNEYLVPTLPFPTTVVPTLDEKATEFPTTVIDSVYLPPDANDQHVTLQNEREYNNFKSELDSSASSFIFDVNGDGSTVNFDLDGAASSLDYDLDMAESVKEFDPTPDASSQPAYFNDEDESWPTDDLAPAASLLSALSFINHTSPDHQHHHHSHDSTSPSHQLPSSGLHIIPAPDLSLLPPYINHDDAHAAGAHSHDEHVSLAESVTPSRVEHIHASDHAHGEEPSATHHLVDDNSEVHTPAEPSTHTHSESLKENDPMANLNLPGTFLPGPIETKDSSRIPKLVLVDSSSSNSHANEDTPEENNVSLDQSDHAIESQSPSLKGGMFQQFMATTKQSKKSLKFPDSVSVEIPRTQDSSVQIPIPCHPISNCHRLFGESVRDYEILGSLPACPDGEGRCLDNVLMVYTRLGKQEEVLFGDVSGLQNSETLVEIMGTATAHKDGPNRSMIVHVSPAFKKTATFVGGQVMFPDAPDAQHPSEIHQEDVAAMAQTSKHKTSSIRAIHGENIKAHQDNEGFFTERDAALNENSTGNSKNDTLAFHTKASVKGTVTAVGSAGRLESGVSTDILETVQPTRAINPSITSSDVPGKTSFVSYEAETEVQTVGIDATMLISGEIDIGTSAHGEAGSEATETVAEEATLSSHALSKPRYGAPPLQPPPHHGTSFKPQYGAHVPLPKPQHGAHVPLPKPQYGAHVPLPKPQYGAPPPKPQYGAPPPKPQYRAPPPPTPKPQYGVPSPPKAQYGAPHPPKPQYRAPPPNPQYKAPPPKPQYGVPPLHKPQYGAPHPPKPQYRAPPPNPQYKAPPTKPRYGAPPPPKPQYGAPPPIPQYGAPPLPKPQYGVPPPNPQYGAPPLPKAQYGGSPPKPHYGAPPPPNPQYGAPPPPKPQYGVPPPPNPQNGAPPPPKPQYRRPSAPTRFQSNPQHVAQQLTSVPKTAFLANGYPPRIPRFRSPRPQHGSLARPRPSGGGYPPVRYGSRYT